MTQSEQPPARVRFAPILLTALTLRLAVAVAFLRGDVQQRFFNQATELGRLAVSLLNGHGLSSPFGGDTGPSAFVAPGYPALIALLFRCFGAYTRAAATAILLMQVLFGVLTVLMVMLVAQRLFNSRAAHIAGAMWALAPPLLFFPTLFWESGLSTLLLVSCLALALFCVDQPRPRHWIALGIAGALAMLINPALLLALLPIAAWALYRCRTQCRSAPLVVFGVWLLVFAPWPVRNARVLHAFVPARTNLGYELWQGNRAESNGGFTPELHPNVNRAEFTRYAALGELGYMREKSDLAKAAIRANPARFARLTLQRAGEFWVGLGAHDPAALVVAYVSATSLFALAGFVSLWRRRRGLAVLLAAPLILFPLPYYITHPDFRFRLILDPLAVLLAAHFFTRKEQATRY